MPGVERPRATASTGFAACPQFFAGGVAPLPPRVPKLRELCYDAFAVLHSGSTRTPVFAAKHLNRRLFLQARDQKRSDRLFAAARLPRAEWAEFSDCKGSGYARGHMVSAGDLFSVAAMEQLFSLANMVPQNSQQNSGSWAKIEEDTRPYVMRAKGDVYIITRPVFEPGSPTVGTNQARVPTHLFKVVYDATTQRAWAHWQPNSADSPPERPISYGDLERRTGMEWVPGVALK